MRCVAGALSRTLGFVSVLWGLLASVAQALPAHYSVSQLYHTQWTGQEGAPSDIEFMAQTPDGFLWLASPVGLFRFDGVSFERFSGAGGVSLLSNDVFTLHVDTEGGLWIGYNFGAGVSRLREGRLTNYPLPEGLPTATVMAIARTRDGAVWVGTTQGVRRLEHEKWRQAGDSWNLPTDFVEALVVDRDGTLWRTGSGRVFYLRPGARQFEQLPVDISMVSDSSTALDPQGVAVYCAHGRFGSLKLQTPAGPGRYVPEWNDRQGLPIPYGKCLFDRDGHLWIGGGEGVGRFHPLPDSTGSTAGDLQRFRADLVPLSGEFVNGMLEDREGNIWFATRGGLDRFRAPVLSRIALDAGSITFPMASAAERGMWIGTSAGNLYRIDRHGQEKMALAELAQAGIDTLYVAPAGTLWVGGGDSIWELQPDRKWRRSARLGPAHGPATYTGANIRAMTQDAQGAMWVSVRPVGVYRVVADQWTLWGGRKDLPARQAVALFTDARGRIWFGYSDGTVVMLDGDRVSRRSVNGAIMTFAAHGEHVLIGGERGLWCAEGEQIKPLLGDHGPFGTINGIASTPAGDLWLSGLDGAIHIKAEELQEALRNPAHRMSFELRNYLDGMPGVPRGAAASGDRIWFTTYDGVAWTDSSAMPRNDIVPTVIVKSMIADNVSFPIVQDVPIQLPVRTRNLQISYTAPSLTLPQRVMFRYRLDGNASEWQDVGTRREAYFTDLAPGRYRFRVIAANNDGLWNDAGASVEFVIPPTFIQTPWFTLLWVSAIATAIWLLFLLRLRSIKSRMRLRMDERERIARELHDTFLQAVQGLMLRFQSAMERIPPHEHSRTMMEDALDRADRVIADGRDAVSNLRAPASTSTDLSRELREAGELLAKESGVQFVLIEEGQPRELHPDVRQESLRIAAEALSNAFHHSGSARIELQIGYERDFFSLRVSDNGRGFDPNRSYEGHWGLIGMRERATRLRGRMLIDSGVRGTTITLEIPARIAYVPSRHRSLLRRLIG